MKTKLALVGGGLANSLIAYRLCMRRPDIELFVLEQNSTLGGNHTWSFHTSDLSPEQLTWITPFVKHAWSHYQVSFPGFSRQLKGGYQSMTSARLHNVVCETLGDRVLLGTQVEEVTPAEVRLAGGTCIQADAVLDGRGDARTQHLTLGYQKFLGQSLVFEQAHGLNGPILMDATVEQRDGYRFMYTLPLTESSALIEDTRYSDSPLLDCDELRGEIEQYAASKGWRINELEREEQGILPIVISGDIQAFWREGIPEVPRSGLSAALYHPTTGYSLPEAARLADAVCELDELHSAQLFEYIRSYSVAKWRRDGFFRLLNRMMFLAAEPTQRYRVIKRFYHLPQPLIERFYAGRLTLLDRIRLLTGTPPVPIGRALRALIQSDAASLASVNSQSTRKE